MGQEKRLSASGTPRGFAGQYAAAQKPNYEQLTAEALNGANGDRRASAARRLSNPTEQVSRRAETVKRLFSLDPVPFLDRSAIDAVFAALDQLEVAHLRRDAQLAYRLDESTRRAREHEAREQREVI